MGTFTYDPSSDVGRVRRYLGDTRADTAYFDDEEIAASIATQGTVEGAVWECAMQLASDANKRAASRTEGNERNTRSIDDTRRPQFWLELADRFRGHARTSHPTLSTSMGTLPTDGTNIRAIRSIRGSRSRT